jgi:hypothetical protein
MANTNNFDWKIIHVRGAEPIGEQFIAPVKLIIDGHYPTTTKNDLLVLREAFKKDAERVFIALQSLPRGTFDQLLVLMLQDTASSLIVSLRSMEPKKESEGQHG